ncbi:Six-hairpin glycosidase-like protein [Protomyces lactucae-debilis]|uniref:glucan 1,4-alpha-glucosidase n=1 Tax=Protomyces lactucae-debilis TaxID=2754530 RepID=A0A1Y2FDI8_PROLT|nr:Six-hairpin glycosidase-like protein [Protomyces lactucae-debilis]ORY81990.1 Six-hairpin glycosidase-like protein [Protomyces lactucae-debilis]
MLPLFLAGLLGLVAAAPQDLSLNDYVTAQTNAALSGIAKNSVDFPGVIAASLARDTARPGESGGQNYYYQWTRDSALTMRTIINQYASGDKSLDAFIRQYIKNEYDLQRLVTLSGNFSTGGLAEPKYYMNGTAFNDPWGRPQRDGPALRAIAILGYLSTQTDAAYIKNVLDTVVKPDLDYVAANWKAPGFDLWEERNGTHFFTAMVQARALADGASVFKSEYYAAQEVQLGSYLDTFWNSSSTGTFMSMLNSTKPTGTDCGNLLGAIHGSHRYRPSNDKVLASTATLIDEMTGLYNISGSTPLIGRYPSDVYDGIQSSQGNPWFLCMSAVAETLYLAATELKQANAAVQVNDINRNFYKKLNISASVSASDLPSLTAAFGRYADRFLALQQRYVGANFSMSEQINRTTGIQQGARDLTWSYAAFVSAARARAGQLSYSFAVGVPGNAVSNGRIGAGTADASTGLTLALASGVAANVTGGVIGAATGVPVAIANAAIGAVPASSMATGRLHASVLSSVAVLGLVLWL